MKWQSWFKKNILIFSFKKIKQIPKQKLQRKNVIIITKKKKPPKNIEQNKNNCICQIPV